ncbi:MAG: methyltransferase [Treponema sp.]|nr:methyltransferase [Treponema sp.]
MSCVIPYITKKVGFEFRGRIYDFALSHGLFSSAGIDRGSRFLLRVFSGLLDGGKGGPLFPVPWKRKGPAAGILPAETLSVLDAGCGCGVLGICAGTALQDLAGNGSGAAPAVKVRAQDRDELARLFTEYNGRKNGLTGPELEAHTEALLAGPAGAAWDLILSNVPAKAGQPVLEDFIGRSAGMLKSGGLVLAVVVNPLAPWFRGSITARGFTLLHEEAGGDHTVFAWRGNSGTLFTDGAASADIAGETPGVFPGETAYRRGGGDFEMEGVRYRIDAVHGAAGFDRIGAAVLAAAKLTAKLGEKVPACLAPNPAVLIHEPDQGHFPAWFARRFPLDTGCCFVLSGRNILSLEASRRNLEKAAGGRAAPIKTVCAVDIAISRADLALPGGGGYGLAVLFPELVPGTGRIAAYWEGLAALLAENGIVIAALNAFAAEKFDRGKNAGPARFTRLGDFRRGGFRALAYLRNTGP